MKKKITIIIAMLGVFFFSLVSLDLTMVSETNDSLIGSIISSGFSQTMGGEDPTCDPTTDQCGPLMGNSSGTSYCCANTNSDCCYAGAC